MNRWYRRILISVILLAGSGVSTAQEQDLRLVVTTRQTPTQTSLDLAIGIQIRDDQQRIVPVAALQSASVVVDSHEPVPALVTAEAIPAKIAVVLDASGSMRQHASSLQEKLAAALKQSPAGVEFALFVFSGPAIRTLDPVLDFTDDQRAISSILQTAYDPQVGSPTCLYDALVSVQSFLSASPQPADERAVIVITDGKDEELSGYPCSQSTLQDVVAGSANTIRDTDSTVVSQGIPIYPFGICTGIGCSNLDQEALTTLADDTAGFGQVGPLNDLDAFIKQLLAGYANRSVVQASIRPCAEQYATLEIRLIGRPDPLLTRIPLAAHPCYAPRAAVSLGPLIQTATGFTLNATLKNVSPVVLTALNVQLLGPSNTLVYSQTIPQALAPQASVAVDLSIPSDQMAEQGNYILQLEAVDFAGNRFVTEGRDSTDPRLAIYDFAYDPAEVQLVSAMPVIDMAQASLVIEDIQVLQGTEDVQNVAQWARMQVLIMDGDLLMYQSDPQPFSKQSMDITIPLTALSPSITTRSEDYEYHLILRLLWPDRPEVNSAPLPLLVPKLGLGGFWRGLGWYVLGHCAAFLCGGLVWRRIGRLHTRP
ncbi:MAG TPA: vWA domain-containing protein [Herpetosiphonaceae bacterium]|nr:vWA domain-containing protein [Herpetosiphonaceae bacterium]